MTSFQLQTQTDKTSAVAHWSEIDGSKTLQGLMRVFDGIVFRCAIDAEWTMLLIGGSCQALTGYEPEDMLGRHFITYEKLTFADDRARIHSTILQAISEGRPYRIEYRISCRDGTTKWVLERGAAILDEYGVKVLQGMIEDISEQIRLQEILADAEIRYRSIFENTAEGIFQTTADGHYIAANPALASIYGYESPVELMEVMLNIESQLYVDSSRRETFKRMMAESGQVNNFESEIRRRDRSIIWISESAHSVYDNDGRFLYYEGLVQDISDRKQSDEYLRISAIAFETQESVIITDTDEVIVRVNRAFCECTGYTAEEVVGKTPRMFQSGRHDAEFYRTMWETINSTGTWQGEIWDHRKNGEVYPKLLTISVVKDMDGNGTHYVGSHIDISEIKASYEEINQLAFYDPLTLLPNRRLLMDRLQHAIASSLRSSRMGALLFLDLDNFKIINDTKGHGLGDLLLQQVAQRLLSTVRLSDTVARIGGDEFVVVLEVLSHDSLVAAAQTETIVEKILATLIQPYQLGAHVYQGSVSIGAALFNGQQSSLENLLKQADIAMYQAKKAGRNTMRFFDPQMQFSVDAHAVLVTALQQAIEQQQFQLYYQIQVDSSNHPTGAETLIRWIHPELGCVPPSQFIPIAEESDRILTIGLWVLNTACAQIKAWQQDELTRDLILAVNVSAKQFRQADFVAQVQAVMQHHGINPGRLKLELTESMLAENVECIIANMNVLKETGIQFSLDDFGTGYSSLQYLKKLPLGQLKIDQSFVRDMDIDGRDNTIVRTIIAMAKSMEIQVIAEGVETEEQRQMLLLYGCHHYQGYLFSKPVPIEQFEALLKIDKDNT